MITTSNLFVLQDSKPKVSADFEDLLSGQGFNAHKDKKGPKTIAEMRKEEMAKEMDPEKLKVSNALLYALKTIQYVFCSHAGGCLKHCPWKVERAMSHQPSHMASS